MPLEEQLPAVALGQHRNVRPVQQLAGLHGQGEHALDDGPARG
jgi:hypothetical protein